MSRLFLNLSKAIGAFSDVLTEDVSSTKSVSVYKYSDFVAFIYELRSQFPAISMCRISLTVENEVEGLVFPEPKYVVRVLMLDVHGMPIRIQGEDQAFLGTVVIATSVDRKMIEFMKGKKERTVPVKE